VSITSSLVFFLRTHNPSPLHTNFTNEAKGAPDVFCIFYVQLRLGFSRSFFMGHIFENIYDFRRFQSFCIIRLNKSIRDSAIRINNI